MKKLTLAACALTFMLAMLTTGVSTASGQVQSVSAANRQSAAKSTTTSNSPRNAPSTPTATRARVWGEDLKPTPAAASSNDGQTLQAHAKGSKSLTAAPISTLDVSQADNSSTNLTANRSRTVSVPPAKVGGNNAGSAVANSAYLSAGSQTYRVGVRDVLDIQLAGSSGKQSTLFTVIDGGLVEYPLAGGPIQAAGLTTAEVAELLRQRLKILDNPRVIVGVRDYASHTVTVTGFVGAPGVKNLRREAVPLYAMLAEALMHPEAARATITRPGRAPMVVDLRDPNLASTLVLPGDVIKVSGMPASPTEFIFVGGEVSSPGQKPYHAGVTLTQAILACGGTTKNAGSRVRVSRQGADGRLISDEYNLRKIQDGKIADPVLQKGDRIQVGEDR